MDDASNDRDRESKKAYVKPSLTRVALRPEEAVLGACKTSGVSGPAAAACTTLSCSSNAS